MDHNVIVLFEGETAKKSHQQLFALSGALYRTIEGSITEEVIAVTPALSGELHIVGGWKTILSVALWSRTEPSAGDVLALLKKSGMTGEELSCLEGAALKDIFSWLCREERLELLRRICSTARANVAWWRSGRAKVHCHLVSDETERIVASSL